LKNPKMQLVTALRSVLTARTLLLSGTPIQNNLEELWALMDLVAPGVLGDQGEFKDAFQKRIIAGSARCSLPKGLDSLCSHPRAALRPATHIQRCTSSES
jgi:SNF2 family DNA or RNA helicase